MHLCVDGGCNLDGKVLGDNAGDFCVCHIPWS